MTVTVKTKSGLTVPTEVQRRAGYKTGDRLEFKVSGSVVTIVPELPSADDEYTPEQRKIIDARLAKADADIKAGRMSKAYSDHAEFIADLHKEAKKYKAKTKAKRPAR
jgi:bifunctional DNA-binding transcriptional regulator/antitoxin component of YhaV-PrlF toxin-antitoxin module